MKKLKQERKQVEMESETVPASCSSSTIKNEEASTALAGGEATGESDAKLAEGIYFTAF